MVVPLIYGIYLEIHDRDGRRIQLPSNSQHIDPMTYPILYPYGRGGWSQNLLGKSGTKITPLQYYSYLLSFRTAIRSPSLFLHCGKLSQQYIVDAYCKIESERLNFIHNNQKNLRVEYYRGLHTTILGIEPNRRATKLVKR